MVDLVPDLIANLNDFNDHAYNRFVEKIKVSTTKDNGHRVALTGF